MAESTFFTAGKEHHGFIVSRSTFEDIQNRPSTRPFAQLFHYILFHALSIVFIFHRNEYHGRLPRHIAIS